MDKTEVRSHSGSLEIAPFDRPHTSSYSFFIVTMAVSCTIFKIKRDVRRKTPIFRTPLYPTCKFPYEFPFEFLLNILIQTVRVHELLGGAKILSKSSSLCLGCTVQQRYRQTTDGRLMPGERNVVTFG